ncbi:hypothetical protein EJB05_13306, partial [Eragrostis curvula]
MGRRRGSKDSAAGDRISILPLELRARIASFLQYRQVVQLSVLSRPWCHIHNHTPVVQIYLVPDLFDSVLAARVALRRRAQDASASKVDTLKVAFFAADLDMRRHADRIISLADAREIHIQVPYSGHEVRDAWTVQLPPAARHLKVAAIDHVLPAITGPGAAVLRTLFLRRVMISEWPHLPSLRSLDLHSVTVETPFAPGQWCPLLEELELICCKIKQDRVDINLPHLKFLEMDSVDVGHYEGPPFGHITVDTPELVRLYMIFEPGCTRDFKLFTLRAPKLQLLCWYNQFAERVHINIGKPGSVKDGKIEFMSVYFRKIEYYREQMMRMLQGLLPNVPPDSVADIVRPYITQEECPDSDSEDNTVEEKITCDLSAIMSHDI